MARYSRPASLDEALTLLGEGDWRILAGGTDFYPSQGARPIRDDVIDINGLDELRGISQTPTHIAFSARATWTDVIRNDLPPAFDALKLAAREVGSVQIQNTGTIAGNLCNASPAADGVPPLMILDAEVEVRSSGGTRHLPLDRFIRGNRATALAPGEMVTAVRVPKSATAGTSGFFKLGARRYLVISIAMVAVRLDIEPDGRIRDVAIAVGACSAVAMRLTSLEDALRGQPADANLAGHVSPEHFAGLSPIGDVRASAEYRREAAREIVRRTLVDLAGRGRVRDVAA